MEACISSNVRAFVSGTSFMMKMTVKPHTVANMKKVPDHTNSPKSKLNYEIKSKISKKKRACNKSPAELHCARKLNEYVMIQEPNQLTNVTRLPAKPFTFIGNIWKNHTMR